MKLHVQQFGEGDDLIILHGLFGSGDNWLSIGKQLAKQYRVHLIDQRNHGKSIHCDLMSYPAMAADLKEYLVETNTDQIILIGHSMGGKTAMQFAADYPEYLLKLIIVDIAGKRYPDHHAELIDAMLELNTDLAKSRSDLDQLLSKRIPDIAVRRFLLKNVVRNSTKNFEWQLNINGIKSNYDAIMAAPEIKGSILVPTLFISGSRSSYIQPEDKIIIKEQFENVDFKSLEAGHWLHAELPEQFIQIVTEWIYT